METFRVQCHGTVPYRAQFLKTEFTPLNSKSTKAWEHGTKHAKLSQNLEFKFPWSGQPEKKIHKPSVFPLSLRPNFSDFREGWHLDFLNRGGSELYLSRIHAVHKFLAWSLLARLCRLGDSERGPPGFAANDIIESQKERGRESCKSG
jgi:hypothetical protein